MKVALVFASEPGPAAGNVDVASLHAHVADLARELAERGDSVTVHALDHDPLSRMGNAVRELERAWARERPDVVHAHLWTSGLAALAAIRDLAVVGRLPVLLTFHSLEMVGQGAYDRPRDWLRLEAAVARGVDRVAATSRRELSDLVTVGVRRRDIDVIPYGVDTGLFTPDGPSEERTARPRLVAVGPLTPATGFDTTVQALPGIPGVELMIACSRPSGRDGSWRFDEDPEARRLADLAHRLGVADRLHLRELPPRRHLPALLRSADVVVCTPWHEPAGTVGVEAMACGRPVVASAVGDLIDVVVEGTTGVLVPPRDPTALTHALRELLHDPVRLDGFGLAAADRARVRHGWDRITGEIAGAYERLRAS